MSYSARYYISQTKTMRSGKQMATDSTEPVEPEAGLWEWVESSDIVEDVELAELNPTCSPPTSSPPGNFLQHFRTKKPKPSSSVDDKDFELLYAACTNSEASQRTKLQESSPPHGASAIAGRFMPKPNQYSTSPTKLCENQTPQPQDPQQEQTQDFDERALVRIPARAIGYRTRKILCQHMNPPKPFGNDWKGLADYMGFDMLEIQNFELETDPMDKVLNQWITKKDSTLGTLIEKINDLERDDALSALEKPMKLDAKKWLKKQQEMETPVQVHEVSGTCYPNVPFCPELRGITLNDSPDGPIETFDAYVCHNPDTDYQFVLDMIEAMERPPYNLRFCTDWRDLIPGGSYATATAELIENRCKRMIVVLSPEFLESGHCDFQAKFALALSPGARSKRMVPIMVTPCSPPSILRHITVCDYTKEALRAFFWRRLYKALDLN